MELTLPISSLFIIAIGAVGVCLSIVTAIIFTLQNNTNERSTYLLSLLLFFMGLTLLNETLTSSGISNHFKNLYFIPLNFSLAIAPLFSLFVKTKFTRKIKYIDYIHLVLPILQFIVYLSIGFRGIAYKSKLWNESLFRNFLDLETILFSIGLIAYSIFCLYLIIKPHDAKYFWLEDLKAWLHRMVLVFLIIAALEMFVFIGEYLSANRFPELFFVFRTLLFVLLISWIVYNAISLLYLNAIYHTLPQKKVNSITEHEFNHIESKLKHLMDEEKVFLNPDLSLGILAKYLDISEKNCSQFFSTSLQTNFNRYINKLRVEAFKEKVKSGKLNNLTLLAIAYDCGFDSKSTFNRAFKQLESMTPSAYRKSLSEVSK